MSENFVLKIFGKTSAELQSLCEEIAKDPAVISATFTEKNLDGRIEIQAQGENYSVSVPAEIIEAGSPEPCVYALEDVSLGEELNALLKERGLVISTGESFTSGRVAAEIVKVPGASEVFYEGIVAYSNDAKVARLNVKREHLKSYGAVSAAVCADMAVGLLRGNNADISISTTGIAGPTSEGTDKPVGLCYIGVAAKDGDAKISKYIFPGTREEITQCGVNAALFQAVLKLKNDKIITKRKK